MLPSDFLLKLHDVRAVKNGQLVYGGLLGLPVKAPVARSIVTFDSLDAQGVQHLIFALRSFGKIGHRWAYGCRARMHTPVACSLVHQRGWLAYRNDLLEYLAA
jgi:hypothetical protein